MKGKEMGKNRRRLTTKETKKAPKLNNQEAVRTSASPVKDNTIAIATQATEDASSIHQKPQASSSSSHIDKSTKPTQSDSPHDWFWEHWRTALLWVVSTILATIISNIWNAPQPILMLLRAQPILILIIVSTLVILTAASIIVPKAKHTKFSKTKGDGSSKIDSLLHWVVTVGIRTAFPIVSFLLFILLLLIVLIRPQWCYQTPFCPGPQSIPATVSQGVHDNNLDMYVTTVQSMAYLLPLNPAQYKNNRLPDDVGALRIDTKSDSSLYRVVIGVHNLRTHGASLLIERVALVVQNKQDVPYPLNLWSAPSTGDYNSVPYRVIYTGQPVGSILPASYIASHPTTMQLAPGEGLQLDIQILSQVPSYVTFQVQVTYFQPGDAKSSPPLLAPFPIRVVFSDASNWHLYQLRNKHLQLLLQ
jgi:hypothetical protein